MGIGMMRFHPTLTQIQDRQLAAHLSLWDDEPETVEPYYARRLRVMGERKRRLREAKRLNELYLAQGGK